MRRRRVLALCAALVGVQSVTGPAAAQAPAASPSPPSATAEDIEVVRERARKNKRVCKSSVATGSIMPTRVCRTVGEWEAIRERSMTALENMRREQTARRLAQEEAGNQ